jgi:hypothetical protein
MCRQIVPDVPKAAFLMCRQIVPDMPKPVPDVPKLAFLMYRSLFRMYRELGMECRKM